MWTANTVDWAWGYVLKQDHHKEKQKAAHLAFLSIYLKHNKLNHLPYFQIII